MRKIMLLFALFLFVLAVPAFAAARQSVIKDTSKLNQAQSKIVSEVVKRTTLGEKEAGKYVKMGLGKEDIFKCYAIWTLADQDMDKIVKVYKEENDLELTLKDFDISISEFNEAYENLFPEDGGSPIRRDNVPWLQSPQK